VEADGKLLEEGIELLASAADEAGAMVHGEGGVLGEKLPGLGDDSVGSGADLAGENQGLGLGPRGGQKAGDEEFVGTQTDRLGGGHGRRVGKGGGFFEIGLKESEIRRVFAGRLEGGETKKIGWEN
jgi:hypothetical protein